MSLQIPAGQRVLLVGRSGSGKSTLLRALAGLLDESTGELSGSMPLAGRPGERALLLQQPLHAIVGASVGRDTAFGPENARCSRPEIQERVSRALQEARVVGAEDPRTSADSIPWELSGGQQQRLALAGSLALEPGALLLDEPLSMLDGPTAQSVRSAILEAARGRTLVVADHRIEDWLPHMDRVIVLGDGARILADGTPAQVRAQGMLGGSAAADPGRADVSGAGNADAREAAAREAISGEPAAEEASAESTPAPLLRARDLTIRPRRREGVSARAHRALPPLLTGIDLDLTPGSLTAIIGPSGSGKTTLLRVLLGLDSPAAGSLEAPRGADLAFVPQEPEHSFLALTVREEVTASPWVPDATDVDALLRTAGLEDLADASPYTLSGGQKRRLAVISALAQRPRLLVLDEPTVGLDAESWAQQQALLDSARAEGAAVLVATHDPRLIARADAVLDLAAHRQDRALATGPGPNPGTSGETAARTLLRPIRRRPRALTDALNPLSLLLIAAAAVAGSFGIATWQTGLASLALVAVLAPLSIRTVRGTLLRLVPVGLAAAGLWWSTMLASELPAFTAGSALLGLKEALRIAYFVAPGVLAFTSLDPTALGDALGGRLRLPGRPVAASVAGLVRAGLTADVWSRVLEIRRLRGLDARFSWRHPLRSSVQLVRTLSSTTLAVLLDAIRSAEQQALAMDARGFQQAQRRTWALPSRFSVADATGAGVAFGLAAAPWVIRGLTG
nr:ATP-binding cassette domain-containing protein [Brachybacterium equifaecis]